MVNTNKKEHRILTPEYWRWYQNNKKNCRNYYKLVKEGYLLNNANSVFEDEMSLWTEHLIDSVVPEDVERNLKAGKKRLGKPLPLEFERRQK